MRPYSLAVRQEVWGLVSAGLPKMVIARRLGLACSTIKRYERQYRTTGSLAPRLPPRRATRIGTDDYGLLEAQLLAHPFATLAEHCAWWAANQQVKVSVPTMARTINRLGWVRLRCPKL